MTKRGFRGKPKRKSAGGADNLLSQVQQMQEQMAAAQTALENETVTVTAGGGAVSVTITGHQRVREVTINPELMDPDERELLQDLIVSVVNAAIEQSQTIAAERMESITGGVGGMDGLLGGLGLG